MNSTSFSSSCLRLASQLAFFCLGALCLGGSLSGCLGVEPPDGVLACTTAADCPDDTWACRADGEGALRCFRGMAEDAGMDAPERDAPVPDGADVPMRDTPMTDIPEGVDAPMADAPNEDARPACVDPAIDCPAETACTIYTCVMGACMPADRDCDDGASCTLDVCSTSGGGCSHVPNAGTACGSGFVCDPEDPAAAATTGCVMAPECTTASMCNDMDPCTVDTCVAMSCVFTSMVCPDDGNLCTEPSVCVAGTCTPQTPVTCADDGNACTDAGTCSMATGTCTYPAVTCRDDGNACTGNLRCDTSRGCIEDFISSSLTNPLACAPDAASTCRMCPTPPNTTPGCAAGACTYACMASYVDVDGMGTNGCECRRVGASDDPDLSALDENCDGADGVVGTDIYVSPTGNAASDGRNPASPTTLTAAFTIAASSGRAHILLQAGTYAISSPLIAVDGLILVGGYAANYRSRPGTTLVSSTASNAIFFDRISSALVMAVDFETTNRGGTGETAHTVDINNSSGIRFSQLTIRAGAGSTGATGTRGSNGSAAGGALSGGDGTSTAAGSGGGSGVGAGGRGGGPASGSGMMGSMGGCAMATPGAPGAGNALCSSAAAGSMGGPGCVGAVGPAGGGGSAGFTVSVAASGLNVGLATGDPGMSGFQGTRGGGGGGGGACSAGGGGGGGQGGEGGFSGGGGTGGGGGGWSIGLLVRMSSVTLDNVTVLAANGGLGGRGGDGGTGGMGGAGGAGGLGAGAARGAPGGMGGPGGRGGCGGGGAGGSSYGWVSLLGSTVDDASATITFGSIGGAGPACASGGIPGDPGRAGASTTF